MDKGVLNIFRDNLGNVSYRVDSEYVYGNMTSEQAHFFLEDLRQKDAEYQEEKEKILERTRKADNAYFRNLIKDVRFSGNRTIVFWSDGSKTVAKCAYGDFFDKEKGLMAAICKKFYGDKCILPDMIEKWCKDETK